MVTMERIQKECLELEGMASETVEKKNYIRTVRFLLCHQSCLHSNCEVNTGTIQRRKPTIRSNNFSMNALSVDEKWKRLILLTCDANRRAWIVRAMEKKESKLGNGSRQRLSKPSIAAMPSFIEDISCAQ